MDLPLSPATERLDGPDPSALRSLSDGPSPSHGETLAAAVGADPIASAQVNWLRSAYGTVNVSDVLAAVHSAGPGAIADLTERPEQYGPFNDTPETREHLAMLAGTLPNMDDYGGINTVLARTPVASTAVARAAPNREAAPAGRQIQPDLEPRAPNARYDAFDDRLDEIRTQIRAGGPDAANLRREAALIQATYQAARYLGVTSMTPTNLNPVGGFKDQAMTLPGPLGVKIYADNVAEMIDELGHVVQYNRDPVGFVPKVLVERARGGDDVYDTPGTLEHEAHEVIKKDVIDWIRQIQTFNSGPGPDPFSPDNALFRKVMDYPDRVRP